MKPAKNETEPCMTLYTENVSYVQFDGSCQFEQGCRILDDLYSFMALHKFYPIKTFLTGGGKFYGLFSMEHGVKVEEFLQERMQRG